MKRAQLIEWGIIVIALIFGFKFLEGCISLIIQFSYAFGEPDIATTLLPVILVLGLYAAGFFLVIKNSHKLAIYLAGSDSPDTNISLRIGKRSMLQVILIGICCFTILSRLADIIYFLFPAFRHEVRGNRLLDLSANSTSPDKITFVIDLIAIILAMIIIYASKNIADWMIRKNEPDELILDSSPEN
jgi:hypothetical protein